MAKKIDADAIRERSRERYFETGRDKVLMKVRGQAPPNATAMDKGGRGSHRRSLFVIGETGSGKTRSISRIVALVSGVAGVN